MPVGHFINISKPPFASELTGLPAWHLKNIINGIQPPICSPQLPNQTGWHLKDLWQEGIRHLISPIISKFFRNIYIYM